MRLLISSNKLYFFISAIILRWLLELSFINVVAVYFEYNGYHVNFEIAQYVFSWGVYLLALIMVSDRINKVSDYFFVMAFFALVAPLTVLYGLDQSRPIFPVLTVVFSLIGVYVLTKLPLRFIRRLPIIYSGKQIVILTASLFVIFLVIWYYLSGVTFNLDLAKVYEFRRDNAELSSSGLLAYTNNWTIQIFNIALFILALRYKKYYVAIFLFFIQIYFFAASAHKSILFLPFLILGIWFYFRKYNSALIIPVIFSLVIMTTLVFYYFLGDLMTSSLFSRRVFFVPASLTFTYFDYFSSNTHVFWSNSILNSFINYPYDAPVSHVIGKFLGHEEMSANNGFISSGYANAGLLGVFLYVLILGLMLKMLDELVRGAMPLWLGLALTVIPLRNLLLSSDLLTVLLTHGFFIAILFLYLLRTRINAL